MLLATKPGLTFCVRSALMAVWRQLVQGGVLSDAEFWASRQNLLSKGATPPKQRQAFASQMIASVVPSEDGKSKQAGSSSCSHCKLKQLCCVKSWLHWRSPHRACAGSSWSLPRDKMAP